MSIISFIKGWFGEAQVSVANALFLDSKIYHTINNVTLPTADGTTQIDHIICSRFGIFVIETKNMKGWIFGDAQNKVWTQSLYGKKSKFQNPLHQNYRHTQTLLELLDLKPEQLHSVVMFTGDCTFKTEMPDNVLLNGYIPYIKRKTDVLMTDFEAECFAAAIRHAMLSKTWATHKQHVASLRARHAEQEQIRGGK